MITPSQCRAGRALLDWTLEDLARASGLSRTSLNTFEQGTSNAKADTYRMIREAFERAGVEFLGSEGLRMQSDVLKMLQGDTCYEQLLDDVFDTLKDTGGEILICSVDERKAYHLYPEKLTAHFKRLKTARITERMLAQENDTFFLQPIDCYRWIPAAFFSSTAQTFIYGHKIAIKSWTSKMVIIMGNKDAADAERKRFEFIWQHAKLPSV